MDNVLQSHLNDLGKAAFKMIDETSTAENVDLILQAAFRTLCLRAGADIQNVSQHSYTITDADLSELSQSLRLAYHIAAIGEKAELISQIKDRS